LAGEIPNPPAVSDLSYLTGSARSGVAKCRGRSDRPRPTRPVNGRHSEGQTKVCLPRGWPGEKRLNSMDRHPPVQNTLSRMPPGATAEIEKKK